MKVLSALVCIVSLVSLAVGFGSAALAEDPPLHLPGRDGFELEAKITVPAGVADDAVQQVVVLVHGSGPAGLDHDLTAVTAGDEPNLFFRDIADALVAEGLAVLRYNKRSYEVQQRAKADAAFLEGPVVAALKERPLEHFIDDVGAMVGHARQRFPKAQVVVIGVSQGTYLALQVAEAEKSIDALVLIGFYATSLDSLIYEQMVHRSLGIFDGLDTNGDAHLTADELKNGGQIGIQLLMQSQLLDMNKDERCSRSEFMAGNFTNLVARDILGTAYRTHEASLPRVGQILSRLEIPVLFFQGEWDNQTPAFHARGVDMTNRAMWGRKNFTFRYLAERGHILDPRESYGDLVYQHADPAVLSEIAKAIVALRPAPEAEAKLEP